MKGEWVEDGSGIRKLVVDRWKQILVRHRYLALTILFVALGIVVSVLRLPKALSFRSFAFMDAGAGLVVEQLVQSGDRPGIDNGYIYGLLSLFLGHLWYGLLGLTPWASFAAWCVGGLLTAWGMARFAYHARVGLAGLAAMLVVVIPARDQSFVYILEPIFLIHALAEQARGRMGIALALLTACAFVKPSMAVVYGFVLVVVIVARAIRGGLNRASLREVAREILPAAVTGGVFLALFAAIYGPATLLGSIVPARAAAIYKAGNFGFFFGKGRAFWYFPGVRPGYYLGTPVGFWLIGSIVLAVGAIGAGLSAVSRRENTPERPATNTEVVVTCALLHFAFVCFFYGNQFSYEYYFFILVCGLAALAARSRAHAAVVLALALIGFVGGKSHVQDYLAGWRAQRRSPETLGLFADPADISEWIAVRAITRGQNPAILAATEGATVLFPDFAPPRIFYLNPPQMTSVEIDRKTEQLRSAPFVVEATSYQFDWPSEHIPFVGSALEDCEVVHRGTYYRVYSRSPRAGSDVRSGPGPAR